MQNKNTQILRIENELDIEGMNNSQEYIGETLKDKVTETFEDAIENAVKGLIAEVGENVTMMTVGTTVTGAMSPVLPQLAAAKVAISAINAVLNAFGL